MAPQLTFAALLWSLWLICVQITIYIYLMPPIKFVTL